MMILRGFIRQKKLIELRLSNNKIFKVTNSTFDGLKTVTILSLRKNFLEAGLNILLQKKINMILKKPF